MEIPTQGHLQSLREAPDLPTTSGHRCGSAIPTKTVVPPPPTTSGHEWGGQDQLPLIDSVPHAGALPTPGQLPGLRTHRRQLVGCAFAVLTIKQLSGYWEGIGAGQPRSESTRAVTPSCLPGCLSGLPPPVNVTLFAAGVAIESLLKAQVVGIKMHFG